MVSVLMPELGLRLQLVPFVPFSDLLHRDLPSGMKTYIELLLVEVLCLRLGPRWPDLACFYQHLLME